MEQAEEECDHLSSLLVSRKRNKKAKTPASVLKWMLYWFYETNVIILGFTGTILLATDQSLAPQTSYYIMPSFLSVSSCYKLSRE